MNTGLEGGMGDGTDVTTDERERVEPVVATIALTTRDIRDGILESSPMFGARWLIIPFGVAEVIFIQHMTEGDGTFGLIVSVLFGAVLFASLFMTPERAAKRQIRTLMNAGDTNVTYRFDAEGLTTRSAGATGNVAYRRLIRSRVGKKSLLLYFTDRAANIVPLRAFSPDELARVLAFLPPEAAKKKGNPALRTLLVWAALVVVFLGVWQWLSRSIPPAQPAPSGDSPASR